MDPSPQNPLLSLDQCPRSHFSWQEANYCSVSQVENKTLILVNTVVKIRPRRTFSSEGSRGDDSK